MLSKFHQFNDSWNRPQTRHPGFLLRQAVVSAGIPTVSIVQKALKGQVTASAPTSYRIFATSGPFLSSFNPVGIVLS